ncbi:non-canonical purine NTP pyrophosphatase [Siminovitchia terrae]|uniref:dITP/XTP pyrophosphatase n=1 Tax=Siminovitchia terrae TaxID=1914933 RepID=A0A429X126_SIMTE|nr:XTP/dITP diphosphatase [Siminovitchia terrae]RST57194.1 XTP/dITP diphosphatase [Siminovitchia terrae]GIN90249.1 non-canonical purine NTP pyrophosphatase [Siminovitchia terrae]
MKSVIIATKNKGKAKEFEQLFSKYGMEVKTLIDFPNVADIEETGETFEENAIIKAEAIAQLANSIAVADDSGLVIDALDGRPGVFSARYAGAGKNDEDNIDKVLDEMEAINEEERTARFYCALAIAGPSFETVTVSGTCEGKILNERRGSEGFGYDPIFFVPTEGKTMAELTPGRKNELSHRAAAMKNLEPYIEKLSFK